jgi:prolyl-tRNA editing enzyme YbaK/EbsC (Cys-tRNA(Pro) deacylase)
METHACYEEKLKDYMKGKGIMGEHLTFTQSGHLVTEAAAASGVGPEDFVKSICMVDQERRLIVCIVKGEDRASTSRVAKVLGNSEVYFNEEGAREKDFQREGKKSEKTGGDVSETGL